MDKKKQTKNTKLEAKTKQETNILHWKPFYYPFTDREKCGLSLWFVPGLFFTRFFSLINQFQTL